MTKSRQLRLAALLLAAIPPALLAAPRPQQPAQARTSLHSSGTETAAAAPVDPQIAALVRQVSAARIRATDEKLVSFGTRLSLSPADPAAIASGRGIGAAREWIKSELERYSQACGGCLEVKTDSFVQPPAARVPQPTEMVNVYAVLRGTDPGAAQRIYLVTGHYDSRNSDTFDTKGDAPGANDDGSGTAVSLECARVLSRHKFPATLIFLTVAGEEQGLLGSKHFADTARKEGWDLEAALNNDIVGGDRSPGQNENVVRVFSEGIPDTALSDAAQVRQIRRLGDESDSPSRELARYIAFVGREYLPGPFAPMLIFRPDRYLRGGDHTSFNQDGFAAVRLTDYRENYNHQHNNVRTEGGIEYGDVLKWVDFDHLAQVARLNSATLAALASAPPPPQRVIIDTKKLENDPTLEWTPAPAGETPGFEVVWRATTASQWEQAKPVGKVTSVTLPLSKDNVIFGVRSVDARGHRSLVVMPQPSENPDFTPRRR